MKTPLVLAIACLLSGCISAASSVAPGSIEASADADCLRMLGGIDLQTATIADLQAALEAGEITSVELVQAYLARIDAYDNAGPKVNSVQVTHPDALAIAAALDAERAAGNVRGPLHGIPVLLKDNVGTNDMPTTAGSIALELNVPPEDATLTARLRDAGAIILGKSQLSEFANWVSLRMPNGYSSLGGQVVNAYTGGDPSGSSSGSGVAGSMALATATIGTETSGSILSPSNANSLVGVKPTVGLVSRAGVIPLAGSFDTPGPMTRNVYDAAAVLSAIAGPDPRDPATRASAEHLPPGGDYTALLSPNALQGVRLGYSSSTTGAVWMRALDDLRAAGATLVPLSTNGNVELVGLAEIPLIPNEFKAQLNHYLATEAGDGLPVSDLTEIILYNHAHPEQVKYGQELLIASDATPGLMPTTGPLALPVIAANRAIVDHRFEKDDLDAIVGRGTQYVSTGAAAGYPTVIVPAGYNGRTPQGVSFFGPAWSEASLLSYAYAYEQASMRREPPTTINPSLVTGVCVEEGPVFEREPLEAPDVRYR